MLSRNISNQARASASLTLFRGLSTQAKSDDRHILPVSKVPTYHFQKSLPRLKIPELDATLNKYLATIQPLVTPEEFEKTKAAVEDFRKEEGPKLHAELVQQDKTNKHTSYISAPWYAMYLEDRSPLPINYNPQITMNDSPVAAKNKQAERTASLISAALKFYTSLKEEVLYPDIFHTKPEKSKTPRFDRIVRFLPESVSFYGAYLFGAYPLDMSQYSRLFASTRIPKKGGDILKTNPSPEHVIIQRNNHFYKLIVRNADGSFLSEDDILGGINAILNDSTPKASHPIGILSTENRDKWAELREELHSTNKESLDAVDGGLFVVSLDEERVEDPEKLSRLFLFGDGKNRWFDKSFSLVITGNGKAAVNFEHAWGDGVAVVRFLDEIFNASNAAPVAKASTNFIPPKRLEWNLTPKVLAGIEQATQRFTKDSNAMDLKVLTTDVIKRQQLKDFKVSPDGFLQMSFQLAYAKLYGGKTATTYESASTAAFKHGRTEAIRSATLHSVAFTKAFLDSKSSTDEKNDLLRKAINNHSKISVEAMTGNGVDRHLFAMRYIAQKKGSALPAIYQDKAYKVLNTNILSTSTLASPAIVLGGFGPVAEQGYGIGYGMDEHNLRFNVTSYLKVSPFLGALEESLRDMQKVLASSPVPQSK